MTKKKTRTHLKCSDTDSCFVKLIWAKNVLKNKPTKKDFKLLNKKGITFLSL